MWSDQTVLEGDRRTAAGRAARELTRRIADGGLAPGAKLPGETVLARRLGISRPTLREAIRTLAAQGLLEIRPRSGTYVARALPALSAPAVAAIVAADPARLWELLEIRKVVDIAVAELAARRRTPADLQGLAELAASLRTRADDGSGAPGGGQKLYARFFSLLAQATHNTLLTHLAGGVVHSLLESLPTDRLEILGRPRTEAVMAAQLLAVYRAVENGDPDDAGRAAAEHLRFLEHTLRNQDA